MAFKNLPNIDSAQITELIEEYKKSDTKEKKDKILGIIILSYTPYIKSVVYSFARRANDPVEDLYQVSSIGIIKAVNNFDPNISNNFKSYATSFILSEIRHYLRDKIALIRAPRQIRELTYRIKKVTDELTIKYGIEPTDEEIADALEIETKKINAVMEIERRTSTVSIDDFTFEDDSKRDITEKDSINKYQQELSNTDYSIILKDAISKLDETSKKVIEMSFFEEKTQKAIALELNLNEMKVSRIMKKALQELFTIVKGKGLENYE